MPKTIKCLSCGEKFPSKEEHDIHHKLEHPDPQDIV